MDWLRDIVNRLLSVFPRIHIIGSHEGGVRINAFVFWYWNSELKPGWYLWWPLCQRLTYVEVKPQIIDLRSQSIRTADGKDIVVSGAIQYSIDDALSACLEVQDFDKSVVALALGVILEYVSKRNLKELQNVRTLKTEVKNGILKKAEGWGLRVDEVFITDLGVARNIRLLGNDKKGE